MNRTHRAAVCALALLIGFPLTAEAGNIAVWNFNDSTASTNSPANTAALFSVDHGSGTMSTNFDAAGITAFSGTTANAVPGDLAGNALALQTGTSLVNNGRYLQWSVDTTGYTDIFIDFAMQRTTTGFNSFQFQYSTDGTNFTDFGSPMAPPASFGSANTVVAFDLSSISGLDENANAAFRLVFTGGTNATGNVRIDNLTVEGTNAPLSTVPVPGGLLLGLIGVGTIGLRLAATRRAAR